MIQWQHLVLQVRLLGRAKKKAEIRESRHGKQGRRTTCKKHKIRSKRRQSIELLQLQRTGTSEKNLVERSTEVVDFSLAADNYE